MPTDADIQGIILLPDMAGGCIALGLEEFSRARRRAAEVLGDSSRGSALAPKDGAPVNPESLLDAAGMAALTGVPPSWFASGAARGEIPHYKFGRWVRFRPSEILASDTFVRRIGKENPRAVEKLPPSRRELRLMKGNGQV